MTNFEGYGGKRPLLYKSIEKLILDSQNPRLPSKIQGKDESVIKDALKRFFFLDELAQSMAKNGYFDEEPLVGIPESLPKEFEDANYEELKNNSRYSEFLENPKSKLIIVEGNRRLCTAKCLLNGEFPSFQPLQPGVRDDLNNLPVIIYPRRRDVIAYLGARHIIGVKKWDSYAKARYVASMREDYGLSLLEIQQSVGDTTNSASKTYACYKLIQMVEDDRENYDTSKAKENFSYIMLATGQGPIKDFIGLPKQWNKVNPDDPIPKDKLENLFLLFSWMFGEGKEKTKVIDESRDITGKLTTVLRDSEATEYLIDSRNLNEAYERCGGESLLLLKYIKRANKDLGRSLPLIPKYYNEEVESLLKDTESTLESINKIKK